MRHVSDAAKVDSPAAFLRALIAAEGGSISVERFMREALYHPAFGYYARQVRTVGRTGDFSTAATLHPALGEAIASWARGHRAEVASGGRWHLVELGGGTGELAASVLRSLPWWQRLGLTYHLVEVSEGLRTQQQRRLGTSGKVRWHTEVASALAAADGRAHLFSNEFVDAFPCVQLAQASPGEWHEVWVVWPEDQKHPREGTVAWSGPSPAAASDQTSSSGQRIEIHLSYRRWLALLLTGWRAGRILTIDYGDIWPALYYRRPSGTLRAYFRHQRFTGLEVYRRFGQQDLTADVNFTDLRKWGEEVGLSTKDYGTQTDFLQRWLTARRRARLARDSRFAFLIDPLGAGGAFKVLEQCRCG